MDLLKTLRGKSGSSQSECLQCGLIPRKQYMVATSDPIMHPHECSWCKSIVYFPGPMFECTTCNSSVNSRLDPTA